MGVTAALLPHFMGSTKLDLYQHLRRPPRALSPRSR